MPQVSTFEQEVHRYDLRSGKLLQEYTLPSADGETTSPQDGTPAIEIAPERDLCFYNRAAVRLLGVLNNSVIGAEILEMGWSPVSVCSPIAGTLATRFP